MTKEFRNATLVCYQHCIDHRRAKCKLGGSFQSNVESNGVMCSDSNFSMLDSHFRDGNADFHNTGSMSVERSFLQTYGMQVTYYCMPNHWGSLFL